MKRLNFSPVVMLILGVVPFLLMIVQWGAEDVMGVERAINNMTRWETGFQIGVEMFILGLLLWGIDWLKEFIRLRKWRREFVKDWQSNYKELDEEAARTERVLRVVKKMNEEEFMQGCYCQPSFDGSIVDWAKKNNKYLGIPKSTHTQCSEDTTDNGTMIIHRWPIYSNRVFPFGKDVPEINTAGHLGNGSKHGC